jgi:hypothetical protein
MDPYIESPELWSDFHNNLASEIQAHLNRHIQPHYFARLTPYVTYEVVEIGQAYGVRPDVGIWHLEPAPTAAGPGTATISAAPAEAWCRRSLLVSIVEIRTTAPAAIGDGH